MGDFTAWQWLLLVEHELLVFAGVFFLIGAVDEFAVDICWIWLRLTGRATTPRVVLPAPQDRKLSGVSAVFIPAWQEAEVIGATVRHALSVWPESDLRIYVGCYPNDVRTTEVVDRLANDNPRVRLVLHNQPGPTTKADCLNRLYFALAEDEATAGWQARMVVLHDAEDMVDAAALSLLDQAINEADLVQLPVRPEPHVSWVGSHYCEEFAEAHAKAMVVRQSLDAGLPSAGVGCAIARPALERLAAKHSNGEPFSADCLTEDYELGLGLRDMGLKTKFLRVRDAEGNLVATRACFPATLKTSVRQKTRWIHGISLQGWDRLGWSGSVADFWMRLRDRRGPFASLVLVSGYLLLFLAAVIEVSMQIWPDRMGEGLPLSPWLVVLLWLNLASFIWRAIFRFAFTAREYGFEQGLRSVLRIPLSNIIAIMAGRRAFVAYLGTLRGKPVVWDKTEHHAHPTFHSASNNIA